MIKHILMFLVIGLVWGQADLDKLVLKDGTTYFGELVSYSTKTVIFVSGGVQYSRPISMVERLVLEDGRVLIKNSLTLEEYQKLSTKEKAIYDANLYNVQKYALYGPTSIIVFMGSIFLHKVLIGGEFWESPIFLGGSPAASLTIPYFVLNSKEKFNFPKSILTDSEKEIYEQAYSKKLRERKIKYAAVGTTVSVVIVAVAVASFDINMSSSSSGGTTGKGFTGLGP